MSMDELNSWIYMTEESNELHDKSIKNYLWEKQWEKI